MYYKGFSRGAIPYWLFLLLLVPGVVMTGFVLDYDSNIKTQLLLIFLDQSAWPFLLYILTVERLLWNK
jgi:hypothetical protein